MKNTITVRELVRESSRVNRRLRTGRGMVVTLRGEPFALLIPINAKGMKARHLLLEIGKIFRGADLTEQQVLRMLK